MGTHKVPIVEGTLNRNRRHSIEGMQKVLGSNPQTKYLLYSLSLQSSRDRLKPLTLAKFSPTLPSRLLESRTIGHKGINYGRLTASQCTVFQPEKVEERDRGQRPSVK